MTQLHAASIRVLIVDDEKSILNLLKAAVQRRRPEWPVDFTQEPEHALELISQCNYDVILSDLNMPRINGLGILKAAQVAQPRTPVIFLTGFRDGYAREAWELGAWGVLDKPIDLELLLETLETVGAAGGHLRRCVSRSSGV